VPVYMGTAFKNCGVQLVMDAVGRYLPSPLDAEWLKAKKVGNETEEVTLEPDPKKPLVALAFKLTDEAFGQLTYTRVYQGTLKKGMTIINSRTGNKTRLGRLIRMHSDQRENIDEASAGDIVAMVGIDCASGDTFCDDNIHVTCESMFIPQPVISFSVSTKDAGEAEKLGKALSRFMKEDPTFKVHTDEESKETIVSGLGELHIEIYIERIKREYGV
ncbi:MAG: elongation factor G, partial [Planctomycetaceae bacterium]|nr:elongation factor G [Planctomycetaceae bacterium]